MSKILALLVLVIVVASFLRSRKSSDSEQVKEISKESPKVINPDEPSKQITEQSKKEEVE